MMGVIIEREKDGEVWQTIVTEAMIEGERITDTKVIVEALKSNPRLGTDCIEFAIANGYAARVK